MRAFRGKPMLVCIIICVFLWGSAPFAWADTLLSTEAFFAGQETVSGLVEVPGKGTMRYYAQNDGLWGGLIYEHANVKNSRPFRDSGCGPAAIAMAVAQLVPPEQLSSITRLAKRSYSLCACSLNKSHCFRAHARYILTSQRDFVRFLPLVLGDYAAGNNTLGQVTRNSNVGTSNALGENIAQAYGLHYCVTKRYDEAIGALQSGAAVVALASKGGVFTNTGHYVVLAHVDADYLYVLDPLCREEYKTNNSRKLNILQPGLVSLANKDMAGAAKFSSFMIFHARGAFLESDSANIE